MEARKADLLEGLAHRAAFLQNDRLRSEGFLRTLVRERVAAGGFGENAMAQGNRPQELGGEVEKLPLVPGLQFDFQFMHRLRGDRAS